jgi:hypothetical protein
MARTALRLSGGMFAVAWMCWLGTGPALASTPHGQAASSGALQKVSATIGWRPVASGSAARALATTVARGVTYAGSTSADDPIVIRLSRDGTSVRRISTRYEATCTDGQEFNQFVDGPLDRTIGASGRFAATASGADDLGSGITARKTISLKAKIRGKKLTGSQQLHVDEVDAAGVVLATCDQTATFKAISARGKVFGGQTTQGGPVVVELAATRKTVRHFHIGWQASCTPSGAFQVGDTLLDFPLAGNRFGDDFTWNASAPTGEKQTLRYSLRGKIKRARVTGTFRVKATDIDATGVTSATCDTGAVSYTASSG